MDHSRNVQGVSLGIAFDAEYCWYIRLDLQGQRGVVGGMSMGVVSVSLYSSLWQVSSHLASRAQHSVASVVVDR